MIKVTIIGTGNVSFHLKKAFLSIPEVHLIDVVPGRSDFMNILSKNDSDVFIIAVSDDAITKVARHFRDSDKLVAHTSGSVSINDLPSNIRKGIFYPLQTFSKEREVDFKTIPICVEAKDSKDLNLLKTLAQSISEKVYEISSEQRKALHLAAVFVNNFTNHLYQIGNEICQDNALSFDLLRPLILETASKIEALEPNGAQTGPAKRNDTNTIIRQLELLQNKNQKEIYKILTQSIQNTYGEKL